MNKKNLILLLALSSSSYISSDAAPLINPSTQVNQPQTSQPVIKTEDLKKSVFAATMQFAKQNKVGASLLVATGAVVALAVRAFLERTSEDDDNADFDEDDNN